MEIHFDIEAYQAGLLKWFKQYGRHDLPWQGDFNAYHVWLSEIMLQQTQVKTVIPYFERFIENFPEVADLAAAPQDQVMQLWAGLGYYARARNLHKSAKIIAANYDGIFPNTFDALIQLPGVGRSTANAILSISLNQQTPIMDGNVKRVFSRLFMLDRPASNVQYDKLLWRLAKGLMPKADTQAYTQAQMDLGATICKRSQPRCEHCPLIKLCQAYKNNQINNYPVKVTKKKKAVKSTIFYLYQYQQKVLLIKNPNQGIWGGLYVLPSQELGIGEYDSMLCEGEKHIFTHFELYYDIKYYYLTELPPLDKFDSCWADMRKINHYALPAPLKKHLSLIDI